MSNLDNLQILADKAAKHHEAGRYSSAEKFYLRALKGAPKHPQLLFTIATLYEDMGQPLKSIRLYERALENKPDYYAAALNLGACLNEAAKYAEAEAVLRNAIRLQPGSHLAHFNLGNAFADQGQYEEAISAYYKALEIEPTLADGWFNLGNTLRICEQLDKAMEAYQKAITYRPDFALALVNLGIAQQTLGKFETARASFEQALSIDPNLPAAHYQLSLMGHGLNGISAGISHVENVLNRTKTEPSNQIPLHFAAARLHAKNKDYDNAFEHFKQANVLAAEADPFDVTAYNNYINRLIKAYPTSLFEQQKPWANQTDVPVFIVGMPRSGTTLVEQIIASHPEAHGAGERAEIVRFVRENVTPEEINNLSSAKVEAFTQKYLSEISSHAGAARRITDKMPANFLNLGLIALMFPNAKIIHCRRNPLDTCLSCYFQNFSEGLSFSNDLAALGHYYLGYEALMDHWASALPLKIHDVVYEDLVENMAAESRSLIAYLDLAWDPACLEFFKTDRLVTTASVWQARQPIYSSSVNVWRKYEAHLGPLKKMLSR